MNLLNPVFREDLYRARELRGDWAFGEEIIRIADDSSNDWKTAANGRTIADEELVLRSKITDRCTSLPHGAAGSGHLGRENPDRRDDRLRQLSEEERVAKALELIGIVREITGPRPKPPPLVYIPEEGPDDDEPSGIGG